MTPHLGPGPVFAFEWLVTARKRALYAIRSLFVAVLLAALVITWVNTEFRQPQLNKTHLSYREYAKIGESFFYAVIGTQLALLLLAAPAAAAGAVCLDKQRGTLLHLLVTDLSSAEIVLGKLGTRLIPVLGLVALSVPVMFACTMMGGIDPEALAGAYLVLAGVGVASCALALALSVWGRKTVEVLLLTYLLEAMFLLLYPGYGFASGMVGPPTTVPYWLRNTNPFILIFAPYSSPGTVGVEDFLTFAALSFGLAAACTVVAGLRLRAVVVRQASQGERPTKRAAKPWRRGRFRLSLDRNPLLWYEWHRKRPTRGSRFVWGLFAFLCLAFTALSLVDLFGSGRGWSEIPILVNAFQVSAGLLLASVASATALADERARGNLDVLLATPLPTRQIVWAKWRAAFRLIPWLVVLPYVLIIAAATRPRPPFVMPPMATPAGGAPIVLLPVPEVGGWWFVVLLMVLLVAYGAAVTSLGLLVALWVQRVGRAVALSVGAFVAMTVGWVFLAIVLSPQRTDAAVAWIIGSPFMGTAMVMAATIEPMAESQREATAVGGVAWIAVYLGAAAVLYLLALASFNHCTGRVPERCLARNASAKRRETS